MADHIASTQTLSHSNAIARESAAAPASEFAAQPEAAVIGHSLPGILRRAKQDIGLLAPADILTLQRTIGNQDVSRLIASARQHQQNGDVPHGTGAPPQLSFGGQSRGAIRPSLVLQTKLTVGAPNDVYEKEADSVAEEVMSRSAALGPRSAAGASGSDEDATGNHHRARQDTVPAPAIPALQRQYASGHASAEAPSIVENVLATPGQPLTELARKTLEPGFGHDFSEVRVHDDSKAAESASALNALAYTVGNHVVFGQGQYAPGTNAGNRLLAHELTHTIQQTGGRPLGRDLARLPDSTAHAALAQDTSSEQRQLLQRAPKVVTPPAPTPAPQPAAPQQHYVVGGVSYTEDQYQVAVVEVADLWTAGNGIVAKQKTAVARFCSKGAAGADKEPDLYESVFNAAVLAIIGIATDGVGLAVGAAAEAGIGKLISLLPKVIDKHSVEAVTKKVLDAAIDKGKEKAKEAAKKALEAAPSISTPAGYRKLATPLASFQAALEDSIDLACGEEKIQTLQRLLDHQNTSPPEAKWVAAAALYDGLKATLNQVDEVQWNATSDAWLNMQMASGRATSAEADVGRVLIDLKDTYPNDGPKVDAAYLYGQGVNETTLEPYNDRALGEIGMSKLVSMDGGKMGRGWVDCNWKMLLGPDNSVWGVKGTNRYGELWLAAHAVGKEDLDFDDREFNLSNVDRGAQKVWDEIKDRKTKFKEAGATSGPGPW